MVLFNTLLKECGIDLSKTRLLRHADNGAQAGCSPVQLWRAGGGKLEQYQAIQKRPRFDNVSWLASFVRSELGETIFIGTWRVCGVGRVDPGERDPVRGSDVGGYYLYNLVDDAALAEYCGRILIDWGGGAISWMQNGTTSKKIVEIRREAVERPFPGFMLFCERLNALSALPVSWQTTLSAARGIYALTCTTCGQQYVRSACGERGFWGRWLNYMSDGHGGNEGMKRHQHSSYQVSILELAGSSASQEEIIKMEEEWKRKLLTVHFGLNLQTGSHT